MTPSETPPVALPLTEDDLAAVVRWHPRFRAAAMRLRVGHDHQRFLDVVEAGEPWPSSEHEGIRWMVGRDQWGLWIDDLNGNADHWARADGMGEALDLIRQAAKAERQRAIAAIPKLTTGRVDTLLTGIVAQRGGSGRAM